MPVMDGYTATSAIRQHPDLKQLQRVQPSNRSVNLRHPPLIAAVGRPSVWDEVAGTPPNWELPAKDEYQLNQETKWQPQSQSCFVTIQLILYSSSGCP